MGPRPTPGDGDDDEAGRQDVPDPREDARPAPPGRDADVVDLAALASEADPEQREAAWRLVFTSHEGALRVLARQLVGDPDLADDVVSDVLLAACTRVYQVRDAHALGAWLRVTLARVAYAALRQERRGGALHGPRMPDLDGMADPALPWLEAAAQAEHARATAAARDRQVANFLAWYANLSDGDQRIVRGRLLTAPAPLPHAAIAQALGRSELGVRLRWRVLRERARAAVRASERVAAAEADA